MGAGIATTSGERANGVPSGTIGCRCCSPRRAFSSSPHIIDPGTHATGAGPSSCVSGQRSESSRNAIAESTVSTRTNAHPPPVSRAAAEPLKRDATLSRSDAVLVDAAMSTATHLPGLASTTPVVGFVYPHEPSSVAATTSAAAAGARRVRATRCVECIVSRPFRARARPRSRGGGPRASASKRCGTSRASAR